MVLLEQRAGFPPWAKNTSQPRYVVVLGPDTAFGTVASISITSLVLEVSED